MDGEVEKYKLYYIITFLTQNHLHEVLIGGTGKPVRI